MRFSLRDRRPWRRLIGAATVSLVAVVPTMLISQRAAVSADSKLANVLADLASTPIQAITSWRATAGAGAAADALPRSVRDALQSRRLRINDRGEVQVYVLVAAVTDANLQAMKAAGATIEISAPDRRRVQARIPTTRLSAVAGLPFVEFIRPPTYARRRSGVAMTEGDAILRSDSVRSQFSLDGSGVRVGVVSDGLKGIFATNCATCGGVSGGPIDTADLPFATGTRNASGVLTVAAGGITGRSFQANNDLEGLPDPSPPCAFAGAGAEGTALLEIVHDVAPGAQLAFANADTDLAFNQAVNFLAASNDVVVDDLGFFGEAYDGTSSVSSNTAAALNEPSNRIRTYVTALGNDADEHYLGTFADSGVDGTTVSGITTTGRLHLFQQTADTTDVLGLGPRPYNLISLARNAEAVIFLTWNDPFGGSSNDYDLYLVQQSTGLVVASSTTRQNGRRDPLEVIDYTNTGAADSFRILVQNVGDQAAPRQLNLYSFGPECAQAGPGLLAPGRHERHNYNTASRSIAAQGDAGGSPASVISVGAICSASPAAVRAVPTDESCNDRNTRTIEFFSSVGPTLDGRIKPDVTAIDGVTITAAGSFNSPFFGTSAAAPHVAGIAALLLQAAPCLVSGSTGARDVVAARTTLHDLIVLPSTPMGTTVPDNVFGYGRADALASVQRTLPALVGPTAVTVNGNSPNGAVVAVAGLGWSDPTQCPLTRLSWSGGCGTSPGTTMDCPFGTTKVTVSASNNGVSFSPGVEMQITVTTFSVGATPGSATVPAGQSAVYQLAIQSQGGPFTGPVTLGCSSLPQGAGCSFNPPTVTPGASGAVTTLTVTTTARSPIGAHSVGGRPRSRPVPWLALAAAAVCVAMSWRRPRARTWIGPRGLMLATTGTALTVAMLLVQAACGGGGGTTPTTPPSSPVATASLSATSLTFGSQAVQTVSAPQILTVTNTGNAVLNVSSIAAAGEFTQANGCGSAVAAGSHCAISVSFAPTAVGPRAGVLTLASNASNGTQTVSLTGTGGSTAGGTPAGTFQIGVTGASGSLVQSGTLTLVVQ
ncbi:MAG TPA: choice-of-anchor D domain-containing protein [Vicinamibacterales bacterium]|jgi:hypothetical protein